MRVVLLGDICVDRPVALPREFPFLDGADHVLGNLEGPIQTRPDALEPAVSCPVFSTGDVLRVLRRAGVGAVTLANNHIHDLAGGLSRTRQALAGAGIATVGAGATLDEARAPLVLETGGEKLVVYAFGWTVIGCRAAGATTEGVQPLEPDRMFEAAASANGRHPGAKVLFLVHWNYELEPYPQPAHRELALDLLRAGVDAIVGHHPHVPAGAEMIDGRLVAYSLGNWVFTRTSVAGMPLPQPALTRTSVALEIAFDRGRVIPKFYHYTWDPARCELTDAGAEHGLAGRIRAATPFAGFTADEYVRWFIQHRRRRRLLPVYRDYRDGFSNRVRDRLVGIRHAVVQPLRRSLR